MRIKSSNNDQTVQVTIACANDKQSLKITSSMLDCESAKPLESFKVIDIKIDDLLAKGSDNAAIVLGSTVLNLLQKFVGGGIGFEDKKSEGQLSYLNNLMHERAIENDPEAQTHIAINYLNESIQKCDEHLLELAGQWFKKASDTGHKDSESFFKETWPTVKKSYRNRIQK